MVAYLIALSTGLGGDSEFFVRLPAVLLSAGTALFTFLLAARISRSTWVGLEAVLLLAAMPLAQAGSILMTIDAPLVFFWSLTLFLLHCALTEDRTHWWLFAGIGLGLGLLSKFTMAVMVPQVFLYLALSRPHRSWLRRSGPRRALFVGFLLFLPVIWWNAAHNFVTVRHLFRQLGGGTSDVVPLKSLGDFVGSQAGVVTPVLFLVLMIGLWNAGRTGLDRDQDPHSLFLFCFSVPLLLVCAVISLRTKVQANWAAPAYLAATIAAARWRSGILAHDVPARRQYGRRLFAAALFTGFLVGVIAHFPQSLGLVGLSLPSRLDPTNRLRDWADLGRQVGELHQQMNLIRPTFIFSDQYQIASEMMFYVPTHPRTFNINVGRRMNQFDVWGRTSEVLGWDAVFVTGWTQEPPPDVIRSCETVRPVTLGPIQNVDRGGTGRSWSIFRCNRFLGFPPVQHAGY